MKPYFNGIYGKIGIILALFFLMNSVSSATNFYDDFTSNPMTNGWSRMYNSPSDADWHGDPDWDGSTIVSGHGSGYYEQPMYAWFYKSVSVGSIEEFTVEFKAVSGSGWPNHSWVNVYSSSVDPGSTRESNCIGYKFSVYGESSHAGCELFEIIKLDASGQSTVLGELPLGSTIHDWHIYKIIRKADGTWTVLMDGTSMGITVTNDTSVQDIGYVGIQFLRNGSKVDYVSVSPDVPAPTFDKVIAYYMEYRVSKNITVYPGENITISHDTNGGQIHFCIYNGGFGETTFELLRDGTTHVSPSPKTSTESYCIFYDDPNETTYWARCANGTWAKITVNLNEVEPVPSTGNFYDDFTSNPMTNGWSQMYHPVDTQFGDPDWDGSSIVSGHGSGYYEQTLYAYFYKPISVGSVGEFTVEFKAVSGAGWPNQTWVNVYSSSTNPESIPQGDCIGYQFFVYGESSHAGCEVFEIRKLDGSSQPTILGSFPLGSTVHDWHTYKIIRYADGIWTVLMDGIPMGITVTNDTSVQDIGYVGIQLLRNGSQVDYVSVSTEVIYPKVDDVTPIAFSLDQNYPNPFNPSTSISYTLGAPCIVYLDIYNISGQLVRTLMNGYKNQGRYNAIWNGLDNDGKKVSAGLYLYRLSTGTFVQTRKMVLIQ